MLKITFVNSGYAEGILIECADVSEEKESFRMTVDGGGAREEEFADSTSGRIPMAEYLKKRGIRQIDLMVSTHTHEDHICGQKRCAEAFPPKELWQTLPPEQYRSFCELDPVRGTNLSQKNFLAALNDYRSLCSITEKNGGVIRQICAGYTCTPCESLKITVLGPDSVREEELSCMMQELYEARGSEDFSEKLDRVDGRLNNFSLILLLEYRGKRILLPGDTNRNGFSRLTAEELRADLFKVGHHGQIDGASEELMKKVQPSMVVCCASSDRRYNSAHPELIRMIESGGARMYYSDCPIEGLEPHCAVSFSLSDQGEWTVSYESMNNSKNS